MSSSPKRYSHRSNSIYILRVAVLAGIVGCGPGGPEKALVSGTVTFDGHPIELGKIQFYPIDGTSGPVASASIVDGEYRIENKGGVPVGRHRVQIEGYRKATVPAPGISLEDTAADQYVPAKYNTASELTEEIKADESPAIRNYAIKG